MAIQFIALHFNEFILYKLSFGEQNKRRVKCQQLQCFLIIATGIVPKSIEFRRKYNSSVISLISMVQEECTLIADETKWT